MTLKLVLPPELGDARAVVREVREGVEAVERAQREHRAKAGARVLARTTRPELLADGVEAAARNARLGRR